MSQAWKIKDDKNSSDQGLNSMALCFLITSFSIKETMSKKLD